MPFTKNILTMRKLYKIAISGLFLLAMTTLFVNGQVSINMDGSQPDNTAILDVKSSNRGMLIPRMTAAQIGAIVQPADGLMVYNTENGKIYLFVSATNVWNELSYGTGTILPPWVCGNALVDSRDGKSYKTVLIGSQCWMAENLNIGTMVAVNTNQLNNSTLEKYCFGNTTVNCGIYGGLYQWDEMMQYVTTPGVQGICPTGWHLPTDAEWCTLEQSVDPTITCASVGDRGLDCGGKLKEEGTTHWLAPNAGATNSSGFTALPGGFVAGADDWDITYIAIFWTSTEYNATKAWRRWPHYYDAKIRRDRDEPKTCGYSVRCVKN
jgi:uncharacterized protein (TIGR02145 family)